MSLWRHVFVRFIEVEPIEQGWSDDQGAEPGDNMDGQEGDEDTAADGTYPLTAERSCTLPTAALPAPAHLFRPGVVGLAGH